MNLRFYPRHFILDPREKPTLFFTLSRAYELSLVFSTLYFYDSSPTVFSRFGMDLAGNLDSCHLTRYPKSLMTFSGRNPFSFWLTSVSLTFVVVWYFVLPEEIYISPHRDVRMMLTSVGHWARSEKSIREPAPRPLASGPFSSLSRNVFSLLDLDSLSQAPR